MITTASTFATKSGTRIITLVSCLVTAACGDAGSDDETSSTTSTSDTPTSTEPTTATSSPADSSSTAADDTTTDAPDTGSDDASDTDASDSSSSDSSSSDTGSTSAADGIEIAGGWSDGFGTHDITDTSWVSTYGRDVFPYTITQYDNDGDFAIAQDDAAGTWTRYDWLFLDDELWYCTTAFGLASEDEAVATPAADGSDPANGGCAGFSWSPLTPL
jgi:hypothetical protein